FSQRTGQGTGAAVGYVVRQVVGLSPAVLLLLPLGLLVGGRRPNAAAWATLATLGVVVAWAVVGFLTGRTLGWLRYSIAVIPLDSLLVAAILGSRPGRLPALPAVRGVVPSASAGGHGRMATAMVACAALVSAGGAVASGLGSRIAARRHLLSRPAARVAIGGGAVALLAVTLPIGGLTMLDERNNPGGGEGFLLRPIVHVGPYLESASPLGQYAAARDVATYLDSLALRDGEALIDSSSGFAVILQSSHPRQFVITSDRDFDAALQSPQAFGVRYFVVPEDVGYAKLDAVNRAYPELYRTGGGIAHLVRTFSEGGTSWRVYDMTIAADS
ncbi:MAG TPA: hypothetical protein VEY67_03410, partial [Candidatus Dormibacteraeota bacterium]|nr:hypothetical protein [Candidatus Dormibacteraeota bacterium]